LHTRRVSTSQQFIFQLFNGHHGAKNTKICLNAAGLPAKNGKGASRGTMRTLFWQPRNLSAWLIGGQRSRSEVVTGHQHVTNFPDGVIPGSPRFLAASPGGGENV